MDLTTQMLRQLEAERAAINETIEALEDLARRQANGGGSTDRKVVRIPQIGETAMSKGERPQNTRRK